MNTVAVIGGGVTGLTAGFQLARAGAPVTVYEAGERVGGVIQTVRRDGYLAEHGPNSILETSPRIKEMVSALGLEGERVYSDPKAENRYVVRGRKPVAMPVSPTGFFSSPLFSWSAKLNLLKEPFVRRAPAEVEESVEQFVIRRLGREFLDYAINPFVAGVYAGDPARLSVKQAFPKLNEVEQRYGSLILGQLLGARERRKRKEVSKQNAPKFSFRKGLQALTDGLKEHLGERVALCSRVTRVTASAGGWRVEAGGGMGDGVKAREHSAVVFACPAHKFPGIRVEAEGGEGFEELARIRYAPVTTLVLGFRREDVGHPLDGFGMLIPEVEGFKMLGTIFSSSLFPERAPEGHAALTCYLGGARAPELAEWNAEELVELALKDLGVLLGVRGRPTFIQHCCFKKAIPQYEIGYGRYKEIMTRLEAKNRGLFFAGHYRDGISLGDSISSGFNIAERIRGFLAGQSDAGDGARVTEIQAVA